MEIWCECFRQDFIGEQFIRIIADTIGISDVVSRSKAFIRSIADGVGITDILTRTTYLVRGHIFITGIAKPLKIAGSVVSLRLSGIIKSLKITGSGE